MEAHICNASKEPITNNTGSTIFPCPKCGHKFIVRSTHAREIAAAYKCPNCKFVGPN
ncbi:MAG: RNA-binding protein [DPANN group archaeon]|nr:RNA-binding protein [DPANN group archaeon]